MARRRARILFGAAVVAASAGYLAANGSTPAGPSLPTGKASLTGDLAYLSVGNLYVRDSATNDVVRMPVPTGWMPTRPMYSHDGRWLTYIANAPQNGSGEGVANEIWLANADGSDARQISGLSNPEVVGWSPRNDLLAVLTSTSTASATTGGVEIVSPGGSLRTIAKVTHSLGNWQYRAPNELSSATWSPDSTQIAVAITSWGGGGSLIRAYPVAGGRPTTWFSINGTQVLPGVCSGCGGGQTIADLTGWWSGWGIGFWVFTSGMVHNNDQTPIELVHAPGATPHIIGETLSDGATVAIATGPGRHLALVDDLHSGGRVYTTGKAVEACNANTEGCTPIPDADIWTSPFEPQCHYCQPSTHLGQPGSGESIDPSWSPDGRTLAFVRSPAAQGITPIGQWDNAHLLYEYAPATGKEIKVAGGSGASVPEWSRDGERLLFVAHDSLWIMRAGGGTPTEVSGPLFSPAGGYYDQMPWTAEFAWSDAAQ